MTNFSPTMLFIPPVALQPLPYTFSYRCNNILLSNLIGPITPTMIGYQPQPCMLLPFCIEIISRLIPGARRAPCNRHELHFSTHSMPLPIPCIPISHTLLCPGLLPAMPETFQRTGYSHPDILYIYNFTSYYTMPV